VPIENSVEGGVPAVLDSLIADPPLVIVREAQVAVEFALMARPGTALDDIRTVSSHTARGGPDPALAGREPAKATVLMSSSTAEAAAQAARGEVDASVSAPVAAIVHGLEILADDIADNAAAVTRFVLVRPPGPPPAPTALDRTTLAATTENRPGALLAVLNELAVRGVDLTRIESRPIKGRRDEYWFHLDCTGHVAQPAMGEALAALHRRCLHVRYLGSYPRSAAPDGGLKRRYRGRRLHRRAGGQRRPGRRGPGERARGGPVRGGRQLAGRRARREAGMSAADPAANPAGLQRPAAGAGAARADRVERAQVAGQPAARPALNELGRAQAEALGAAMAVEPITAVYASTAVRAQQTAAPVAARRGLTVEVVPGVHEVFCGDLEGRSDERQGDVRRGLLGVGGR